MNREALLIVYSLIAIRIFVLYISSYVASNIMNQIYTERVLINGDEPPNLNFQLYLFVMIDSLLNLFLLGFAWAIIKAFGNTANLFTVYVTQYGLSTLVTFLVCLIISNMMYMKKYFLYKDDGLRAIRVLKVINFRVGVLMSLIPMFLMLN
jgi:hypothetical protein|tara:strand:- start:509 stop:961 length:453 start_codon:yes stop_codon:yes gene_type:complete